MTPRRALWALLSAALAVAINFQQRPSFARSYDRVEYEKATGKLQLRGLGSSGTLPLANAHVVTTNVSHVGKRYEVRQLSLRAADDVLSAPGVELFASLPTARGQDLIESAHNPELLQGLELPVEPTGWLGRYPSYVMIEHQRRASVASGTLRFERITRIDGQPHAAVAEGELLLQLETDGGLRKVSGSVQATLVWDAD